MSDEKSGFIIVEAKAASLASLASGVSLPKDLQSIKVCTVEEQDIIFEIKRDEKGSIKIILVEGKNDDNVENEKIPEEAVARINNKYYTTLQNAINEVPTDNTQTIIVILKDIYENVSISENRNIVIDLNNKILNKAEEKPIIILDGNSNLTINNGKVIGNNYKSEVAAILVNANTTLNLSNTNVERTSTSGAEWETIELHGNLNVDSGEIKSSNSNTICTYTNGTSKVQMINVAIISDSEVALSFNNTTTFTIEGGTIKTPNSVLQNRGVGTIKGTSIVSSGILANAGELCLDGVYINTSISNAVYNFSGAKLEVKGECEILCETPRKPTIYNLGELNINGGTITHTQEDCYAVYNKGGTVNISDGVIISSKYGC